MVIVSVLPYAELERSELWEGAPHFKFLLKEIAISPTNDQRLNMD